MSDEHTDELLDATARVQESIRRSNARVAETAREQLQRSLDRLREPDADADYQDVLALQDKVPPPDERHLRDGEERYTHSTVRLDCPHGHRLVGVTLYDDQGGVWFPVPAGEVEDAAPTAPGLHWSGVTSRWKLRCSHRGCRYNGTLRAARVMQLYLAARQLGRQDLTLPS